LFYHYFDLAFPCRFEVPKTIIKIRDFKDDALFDIMIRFFQSIFHDEIQINIFYFLKIIFKINTSKQSKIYKKI